MNKIGLLTTVTLLCTLFSLNTFSQSNTQLAVDNTAQITSSQNAAPVFSLPSIYGDTWVSLAETGLPSFSFISGADLAINNNGVPHIALMGRVGFNFPYNYVSYVYQWTGSAWSQVGGTVFSASSQWSQFTSVRLAFDNQNRPIIAYQDAEFPTNSQNARGDLRASAKRYDGTNWVQLGTAGLFDKRTARLSLTTDSTGKIYLAYFDGFNISEVITYDDATNSWSVLGSVSNNGGTSAISILVDGSDTPVAVMHHSGGFEARQWDGSAWQTVLAPVAVTPRIVPITAVFNSPGVIDTFGIEPSGQVEPAVAYRISGGVATSIGFHQTGSNRANNETDLVTGATGEPVAAYVQSSTPFVMQRENSSWRAVASVPDGLRVNAIYMDRDSAGTLTALMRDSTYETASIMQLSATVGYRHPEGVTQVGTLTATDSDNDALTYSLVSGGADNALFGLTNAGVLSFNAAPSVGSNADADNNDIYDLTVQVTDGALITTQNLQVKVVDITAPSVTARAIDRAELTVTLNEALDTGSVPLATDFSVLVNSNAVSVSNVALSGSTATLTLSSAVVTGDTVTLSYTGTALKDAAGNSMATFSTQPVTNNTQPNAAPQFTLPSVYSSAWSNLAQTGLGSFQFISGADVAIDNSNVAHIVLMGRTNFAPPYTYETRVYGYNGTQWVQVGGLVHSTTSSWGQQTPVRLAFDDQNRPVVIYQDPDFPTNSQNSNGDLRASAKRYDGTNWVQLGTAGLFDERTANLQLAIGTNGNIYASYTDGFNGGDVIAYDANNNTWSALGNTGASGIAGMVLLLDANNNPVIVWDDFGPIEAKQWDGSAWQVLLASTTVDPRMTPRSAVFNAAGDIDIVGVNSTGQVGPGVAYRLSNGNLTSLGLHQSGTSVASVSDAVLGTSSELVVTYAQSSAPFVQKLSNNNWSALATFPSGASANASWMDRDATGNLTLLLRSTSYNSISVLQLTSAVGYRHPEGQTRVATLTATDSNNDTLTFSLASGGADNALFSLTTAGVLSFNSAPTVGSGADADNNDVYEVSVQVSDGSLTATQAIQITVADLNPPALSGQAVDGNSLTLTFTEALNASNVPAVGDFTVLVNGNPVTVTQVSINGTTLTLTLSVAVTAGDTVTVSYTGNALQDSGGNSVIGFSAQPVTNNTVPNFAPQFTLPSIYADAWSTLPQTGIATFRHITGADMTLDNNGTPLIALMGRTTFAPPPYSYETRVYQWDATQSSWTQLGGLVHSTTSSWGQDTTIRIAVDNRNAPVVIYTDPDYPSFTLNSNGDLRASAKGFDGSQWIQLGTPGLFDERAVRLKLVIDSNGQIYASYTDGINGGKVISYNPIGNSWSQLPSIGDSGGIFSVALALDSSDNLVAAWERSGDLFIKQYDGSAWQSLHTESSIDPRFTPTEMVYSSTGVLDMIGKSPTGQVEPAVVFRFSNSSLTSLDLHQSGSSLGSNLTGIVADSAGVPIVTYVKSPSPFVRQRVNNSWTAVGTIPSGIESNAVYLDKDSSGKLTLLNRNRDYSGVSILQNSASVGYRHPEGQTQVGTLTATDQNNDALTYSLASGGTDNALFSLTTAGVLSFNTAPTLGSGADADNNDVYELSVQVTDGSLSATQAIQVRVVDFTAPTVTARAVNQDSLTITVNEALNSTSVPAATDFAVLANSNAVSVSNVAVSGTTVTLTLSSRVSNGDTVTLSYTGSALQDAAGNSVATFSAQAVTNNTIANVAPQFTLPVRYDDAWRTLASTGISNFSSIRSADVAIDSSSRAHIALLGLVGTGASLVYEAHVYQYSGTTWTQLGGTAYRSQNNTNQNVQIRLAFDGQNRPVIIYKDADFPTNTQNSRGDLRASAKRFDGTNWVQMGTPGLFDERTNDLQLAVGSNGRVYASYTDGVNTGDVLSYDETTNSWSQLGNTGASGIAGMALLLDTNDNPVIVWDDFGPMEAKQWDGSAWQVLLASTTVDPRMTPNNAIFNSAGSIDMMGVDGTGAVGPGVVYRLSNGGLTSLGLHQSGSSRANNETDIVRGISGDPVVTYVQSSTPFVQQYSSNSWSPVATFPAGTNSNANWMDRDANGNLTLLMRNTSYETVTVLQLGSSVSYNHPEGQTQVTTLTASDGNNDALTFTLATGGADNALFSLTTAGVLSFNTAPTIGSGADADNNDVYEVSVQVSDGSLSAIQAIQIRVVDVTAPTVTSRVIDGNTMTITFSEALNSASLPTVGDFSVLVNGNLVTVTGVAINGSTLTLTLSTAVVAGDTVVLSYTGNAIQDVAGNSLNGFSVQPVTNNTVANVAPQFTIPTIYADSWRQLAATGLANFSFISGADVALDNSNRAHIALMGRVGTGFPYSYETRVFGYDGTQWSQVGGLIHSTSSSWGQQTPIRLAFDNQNQAVVIYQDPDFPTNSQNARGDLRASAKRYDGSNWVQLGTAGLFDERTNNLQLAIGSNGNIYASYTDGFNGGDVIAYDASNNTWSQLGNTGASGIAGMALLLDANDNPVIVWDDFGPMEAKQWDGSAWQVLLASTTVDPRMTPYNAIFNSAGSIDMMGIDGTGAVGPGVVYRLSNATGTGSLTSLGLHQVGASRANNETDIVLGVSGDPVVTYVQSSTPFVQQRVNSSWSPVGSLPAGVTSNANWMDRDTSGNITLLMRNTSYASVSVLQLGTSVGYRHPERQTQVGTLTATDQNNDTLTYTLVSGGADNAQFNLTSAGVLSFVTAPTVGGGDADNNDVYELSVQVSDGSLSATQNIQVTVYRVNEAPVITQGDTTTVTMSEDGAPVPFALTLTATDINNDNLLWSIDNTPASTLGNAQVSSSGVVSYTPNANANGVDSFRVTVSDGAASDSITVNVTITAVNDAPVISGTPGTSVLTGNAYSFTPTASDIENDTLIFSATGLPTFLSINSGSGIVSGTPQRSDIGVYSNIVISVTDSTDTTNLPAFTLTVSDSNIAPVITQGESTTVTMSEDSNPVAFALTLTATDANNDNLIWSVDTSAPAVQGLAQVDTSGVVSYTPNANANGVDSFRVIVSDGIASDSILVNVTIQAVNDAPVISGTPPPTVLSGAGYSFTPTGTDIDGDTLVYSATGLPGFLSINSSSGLVSGTPQRSDIGTYSNIVITVSDSVLTASLPAFSLSVVDSNSAPVITQGESTTVTMSEDSNPVAFALTLTATDANNDNLIWSVDASAAAVRGLAQVDTSGVVSYTPNADANGVDSFRVIVSDGIASDSILVNVTIQAVNDAPVISGTPPQTVLSGAGYSFTPTGTDIDGDTLVYSATGLPGFLSINSSSGLVSGTPQRSDIGTYNNIVITVSDTVLTASLPAFSLSVVDSNSAPVIDQGGSTTVTMSEDGNPVAFALTLTATDTNNDNLIWSVDASAPALQGVAQVDTNGVVSYIPNTNANGVDSFRVLVSDGIASDSILVNVTIQAVNDAPVISGTPPSTVLTNGSYLFTPTATDVDGDTLSFTDSGTLPAFLTIDATTGVVSGTPQRSDIGTYDNIVITVSDSVLTASLPAFSLSVVDSNVAPVIDQGDSITVTMSEDGDPVAFALTLTATDANSDALIWSIDASAPAVQGNAQVDTSGVVSYTPNANANGVDSFRVIVGDGIASDSILVNVTIQAVNDAPQISGTPPSTVLSEGVYQFTPIATDIEGDTLSFTDGGTLPAFLTIDATTGAVSGTPQRSDIGTYNNIVITVSDGAATASLAAFNLTVVDSNVAPVIDQGENAAVTMSEDGVPLAFALTLTATDGNNDTLIWSVDSSASPLIGFASVNSSGVVSYTPNADANGIDSFQVNVSDGIASDSILVTVTIQAINDAPLITGTPPATVLSNGTYLFSPQVTDVDGDVLTFNDNGTLPGFLTLDTTSGVIGGAPQRSDIGTYDNIFITVTDGTDTVSLDGFSITVVDANSAPVIDQGDSTTVVMSEDGTPTPFALALTATDTNNDILTWSIDTAAQALQGSATVAQNGVVGYVPNSNANGIDSFRVIVSDGIASDSILVNVTIQAVNDAPVISGTPDSSVLTGNLYSFTPTVSDIDGDTLTFSGNGTLPAFLSINTSSGLLSGTPSRSNIGNFNNIVISVSDGTETTNLPAFSITVVDSNVAPVIELGENTTVTMSEDSNPVAFALSLTATDGNNDVLTWSVESPAGFGTADVSQSGVVSYVPEANINGNDTFTIAVSDGIVSDSILVNVTIQAVNDAPEISGTPVLSVFSGELYSFTANATDIDGDNLSFSANGTLPAFLRVDATSGLVSGTPQRSDIGTYSNLVISVSDGTDTASLPAFDLVVEDPNLAPVIEQGDNTSVTMSEDSDPVAFALSLTATDGNDDALSWSVAIPAGLGTADVSQSGAVNYVPNANANGSDSFTIDVSDGIVSDSIVVNVTIQAVNDVPEISGTPVLSVFSGELYSFTATATDIDGDNLSFSANGTLPAFLSVDATSGLVSGTPQRSDIGSYDNIVISVSDGTATASLEAFTLTVEDPNVAPVIEQGDSTNVTMSEDGEPLAFALTLTASDGNNDVLLWSVENPSQQGSAEVSQSGVVGYIPNADFNGTDAFTIAVSDGIVSDSIVVNVTIQAVNDAPVITGEPSGAAVQDSFYSFTPAASDIDSDSSGFVFSINQTISWATFDTLTGTLSGTPASGEEGEYANIIISVDDGDGGTASLPAFTITVTSLDVNVAPTVDNVSASTDEDVAVNITLNGSDLNGDILNYRVVTQPAQGSVSIDGAIATYTPAQDSNGTDSFTYVANDGELDAETPATVNLSIAPVNDAPAIQGIPATRVLTSQAYSFTPQAQDVDNDALTFSVNNLPDWASFDNNTGALSGTPQEADVGVYQNIVINVTDSIVVTELPAFSLEVSSSNAAPTVSDFSVQAFEDTPLQIQLQGQDPDGDNLIFALVSTTVNGSLILSGDNATYTPNAEQSQADSFVYSVTDGIAEPVTATVSIVVTAVDDAPQIFGTPGTSVKVGNSYSFTPQATDIDSATLTFLIQSQPAWASFDGNTGTLSGAPGAGDIGDYVNIQISVTDGTTEVPLPVFNIDVSPNRAPVISGSATEQTPVNSLFSFTPSASDADNDTLVFSIDTATQPAWTSFDAQNGTLSGTPTAADIGDYTGISISVSDGIDTATLPAFAVEVCDPCGNVAPTINGSPQTSVTEGVNYRFVPQAQDINGDSLSFSISNQPGWTSFNNTTGELSGTPGTGNVGVFTNIVISVSDGNLSASLPAFNLEVVAFNDPPVIAGTPAITVDQNQLYSFTPQVTDPDDTVFTFSIENQPAWMSFNPVSGTLQGIPDRNDVGVYSNIRITVSDGDKSAQLPAFTVTVVAVNSPPVISGTPRTGILQGEVYSFTPQASDADGDVLLFSASGLPASGWLSLDTSSGTISGTPASEDVGSTGEIVISVTDNQVAAPIALPGFSITVTAVNSAPVALDSSVNGNEDSDIVILAQSNDADGDALTFTALSTPENGTLIANTSGWVYTPSADFVGSDSFTFSANDGELDSNVATVNISVNNINDVPVAQADSFTFEQADTGIYILDVLSNDIDVDGESLILQGVSADFGLASIDNNQISFQAGISFVGDVQLNYAVRDAAGANDQALVNVSITPVDGLGVPVITVPDDIALDATGLLTTVDLGNASAVDADGNSIPVSLSQPQSAFAPGRHLVVWEATDRFGTTTSQTQQVDVNPIVTIGQNQTVTEGSTVIVPVRLNGESPVYPLTLPYTVTGSAQVGVDHTAADGSVTITSGITGAFSFEVLTDSEIEVDEIVTFTLSESLNLGTPVSSNITISEQNIAPVASLTVNQNGEDRLTVAQDEGLVTITAQYADPNPQDTLFLEWTAPGLVNTATQQDVFSFEPAGVDPAVYNVSLYVSDNGSPIEDVTTSATIVVETTLDVLSETADSDGDLIPDAQEGHGDSDGDGIPDYLDAIDDCQVVPADAGSQGNNLLEASGVCMREGNNAAGGDSNGLQLNTDAPGQRRRGVDAAGNNVAYLVNNIPEDPEAANIGGLFDFVLYDLPEKGQSVNLVVPQVEPIPADAIYRKYKTSTGTWRTFVRDENNRLASAPGERGSCPPPGDDSWRQGLNEGDWCVQLTIEDGGPNDDDGIANAAIADPGGVAVILNNNTLPQAQDDSITMQWNTSVSIDVLANDTDADGDALSVSSAVADFGVVEAVRDSLEYTPPEGFSGDAVLSYVIGDGNNGVSSAQVFVTIEANQPPGAVDDVVQTRDTQSVTIDVLANDVDVDGDAITLVSAEAPRGEVQVIEQQLQYTPQLGFEGEVLLSYLIADDKGLQSSGQVSVLVDVNFAPVAESDEAEVPYQTSATIFVLSNDTDADGDMLTVTAASADNGDTVINDDNSITYTPANEFSGADLLVYTVSDGELTAQGSVTLTVLAPEPPPVEPEPPVIPEPVDVSNSNGGALNPMLALLIMLMSICRRSSVLRLGVGRER